MIKLIIWLIGGLGLFLYGMMLMSEGLKKAAGSKIRDVLHTVVKNRFIGVFLGLGITSIIQSSSATTVFVVSLANAGLVTLWQAIPVILGADIGTTVTAWLVSLVGVLKIELYAFPAIGLGFLIQFFARKRKTVFWGQTVLGFGLLFLGISLLKDAFEPLANNGSVQQFLQLFSQQPLAGVLAGALVTMLIQSSSASIAIVQIMAFGGLIDFFGAVCLVLGDNIGTTITAQIAALTTNRAGRQCANSHTIIKVFGVVLILPIVWLGWYQQFIAWLVPGELTTANIMVHIALAHSVFNVFLAVFFLPLVRPLEKLVVKLTGAIDKLIWRKAKELEIADLGLDQRLLVESPHLALDQVKRGIVAMLRLAKESLQASVSYLKTGDLAIEKKVNACEESVDHSQDQLAYYLARLAMQDLGPHTAQALILLQHAINDAEKAADHAVRIVEQRNYFPQKLIPFSPGAEEELARMAGIVWEMIELTIAAVEHNDREAATQALQHEQQLILLQQNFRRNHIDRLQKRKCKPVAGVIFLEVINRLRGVGGHLANINQFILSSFRLSY